MSNRKTKQEIHLGPEKVGVPKPANPTSQEKDTLAIKRRTNTTPPAVTQQRAINANQPISTQPESSKRGPINLLPPTTDILQGKNTGVTDLVQVHTNVRRLLAEQQGVQNAQMATTQSDPRMMIQGHTVGQGKTKHLSGGYNTT